MAFLINNYFMKKNCLFTKSFLTNLSMFLALQLLFMATSLFFAFGGHGIFTPVISFYFPYLIILSIFDIDSNLISFFLLFLFSLIFFFIIYFNFINKVVFYIAFALNSLLVILFSFRFGNLDAQNISISIKIFAILLSIILYLSMWFMYFNIVDRASLNKSNEKEV